MDLDRSLSDLASSYRPDLQPSLDDLVSRARARRRTTVLLSAVSVLILAVGVAVAVPRGSAQTPVVGAGTATPAPAPSAGCDLVGSGAVIDYIDFVQVGDQSMDAWMGSRENRPVVRDADLGEVVTRVTCRLEDFYNGQRARAFKDGYASFLEVGTPVYAVHGYDPRCRVAARIDGQLRAYLASNPEAHVHQNASCAMMPGLDPDGPSSQPGDLSGVPPAFVNTAQLPDCGSVDLLSGSLDAGGVAARDCLLDAIAHDRRAQLRVVYRTVESGSLYSVFGAYGGGIMLYRADVDAFGGHAQPGWTEQTCTGVSELLRGIECRPTRD